MRWLLLSGVLGACSTLPASDAGCPSLELVLADPVALIPEGQREVVIFPLREGIDAAVDLSVSGSSVGTRSIAATARWNTTLTRGDQDLVANIQCGGEASSRSWTVHVYPRLPLSEVMPRECRRLLPMAVGFDCDSVVVDFSGAPLPGFVSGTTSRVFSTTDGGWGRWVVTDAGILRELDGVSSNVVPFPETDVLVATTSYAFTPGILVVVEDGGVRSLAVDAGVSPDDFAPCAASANAIAWCFKPFVIFDSPSTDAPWFVCSLSGDCTLGGRALFVMQDLRTHLVTFRDDTRFLQLDLERPFVVAAQRPTRFDETTAAPPGFRRGDGAQGRMQRPDGVAFGFLADGLETFTVVERLPVANSEFVWVVDGGSTSWARLR